MLACFQVDSRVRSENRHTLSEGSDLLHVSLRSFGEVFIHVSLGHLSVSLLPIALSHSCLWPNLPSQIVFLCLKVLYP